MSKLLSWLLPTEAAADPDDERWWSGARTRTMAGVNVTADNAMTLSTFWACVRFLSETIGSLPLMMYERGRDGGRQRATRHPIYDVLTSRPNQWQTPIEFKSMMQGHVLLRGNAYAQIVPGARGAVDQLIPLHPDRVTVQVLDSGRLRYDVMGMSRPLLQDEMFHLRGLSSDGRTGMNVVQYAANSVGLSMATEAYGSRFFKNDSRPGGVLSTDRRLGKGIPEKMKRRWRETYGGGNRGDIAVLEEGLNFQAVGVPPEEAQFLGTRDHQALDVCRWFGVAPHMVGVPGGVTEWGSGLEQLGRGVVTYTLLPWLVRWQEAISRDLILADQRYYAEYIVEGLLRGDTLARYNAYAIARQWGWLSVNEIRARENMNEVEGGDTYLQPMNMEDAAADGGDDVAAPANAAVSAQDVDVAHYVALAQSAAYRLVRKEWAALQKERERADGDAAAWQEAVTEFFIRHRPFVSDTMQVSGEVAGRYCQARTMKWLAGEEGEQAEAVMALVDAMLGAIDGGDVSE